RGPDHRRAARHAGRRRRGSRARTGRDRATPGCGARSLPPSSDRIAATEAWRPLPASMGPRSAALAAGRNRPRVRREDFSCGPSGRVHETRDCPGALEKSRGGHPVTHKVRVPIIDKRKAQVLSTHGNVAQLMDLATYATFELPVPEEFQGKLASGQEIMYIEALGRRKLSSN